MPLKGCFAGSWVQGGSAGIDYDLVDLSRQRVASVREWNTVEHSVGALGFTRHSSCARRAPPTWRSMPRRPPPAAAGCTATLSSSRSAARTSSRRSFLVNGWCASATARAEYYRLEFPAGAQLVRSGRGAHHLVCGAAGADRGEGEHPDRARLVDRAARGAERRGGPMTLAALLLVAMIARCALQQGDAHGGRLHAAAGRGARGGRHGLPARRPAGSEQRRGQVWLAEEPLAADPRAARFHLFAEGLHEGMGLKVVGGDIYVVQRTELSRLKDTDGDGVADRIELVSNDWGASGNYHACIRAAAGCRGATSTSRSTSGSRSAGTASRRCRVAVLGALHRAGRHDATDRDGVPQPQRSRQQQGRDIFVTDNQGDWMPACPLFHVREGRFWPPRRRSTGPPSTAPRARPPRTPCHRTKHERRRRCGSCMLCRVLHRRAHLDSTGGKFGLFAEQLIVAELTNGLLMRVQLEKVQGEYQGAVFLLCKGVGSANRVVFARRTLLSASPTAAGAVKRRPMASPACAMRASCRSRCCRRTCLRRRLRARLHQGARERAASWQVSPTQYDYNYWWEYGSPETNVAAVLVQDLTLSSIGAS
ncbi:MAG: hypothetical protein U1E76_22630 [Planctomycetota bacterium]